MTLSGIINKVIFRNAETGYTVLSLETEGGEVCAVGILPLVAQGEMVEMQGEYMMHPNYGSQFVVSSFASKLPVGETAIFRYLASGIIKGVREKTARLIVSRFGPDTFSVLENDPERLTEIKGISPSRALKISESMRENMGVKNILLYFQQFGITPTVAFKVYKQWGMRAYEIIKENPYRLCEIQGIGFEKADDIAVKMDYDKGSENRIKAGILYVLNYNLYNSGHTFLPMEKLVYAASVMLEAEPEAVRTCADTLIADETLAFTEKISNTNGVYLRWVYDCENNIAGRIYLSSKFFHEYEGDFERDVAEIEERLGIRYAENQKQAILEACRHNIMILTGGPGTGKTTALNGIIQVLEKKGLTYALAAPTGRAAKRMSELCGKEAKTIHRFLEYTQQNGETVFLRNHENPVQQDVVIIDESSMIDLWLFDHLLDAVPVSASLILVGDANQLPPVGPGSTFKDIIGSGMVATVELKEIFRQARQSLIITNAHKIIRGEMPEITDHKRDFFFIPAASAQALEQLVCSLYAGRLPNAYGFDPMADIQILAPSRKGATGTSALNAALKETVNPASATKKELKFKDRLFREGDKVMQIRNNYDLAYERDNGEVDTGVFNGDIGLVEQVFPDGESLTVRFDDRLVTYSAELLEDLELAYAVTVHKSQGSEFDAVILPLLEGPDILFTRNLLYTAVTRAKKILVVVGSAQKLAAMVRNDHTDKRYCGLKFRLWELLRP